MEDLVCKIEGIVFANRQTGYFILKTRPEKSAGILTVKGGFPGINLETGLKVKFCGKYGNDPTYGRQFNAVTCEVILENSKSGIVAYLTSSVKSIGPITASRLYDMFGEDLVKILDTDPAQIRDVSFLTKSQIEAILDEWKTASSNRSASIFLADAGLTSNQIRSALTRFGTGVQQVIDVDPYRLYECPGIGFATADRIARKLGVGVDDPRRVRSMILFLMEDLQSDGHMYVTSDQILEHAKKAFRKYCVESFSHGDNFSDTLFYTELVALKASGAIVSDDERLYLAAAWAAESESAVQIARMTALAPAFSQNFESIVLDFEKKKELILSEEQRDAVNMLQRSRVCVISGYPGTGKTTLMSAFVHLFDHLNLQYVLLSPTGIAAKRLSQVTGKPAYTIHRALGCDREGNWEFNQSNKFTADVVIVDEMSMVDGFTFHHLITALPETTVVVFVGDVAQLPSVGAGHVLNNLMNCPSLEHVALTHVYRQEGCSAIIEVAHAMLKGGSIDTSFKKESEFVFIPMPQSDILAEIRKLTSRMKEREVNFQVMAPMYNGELGVDSLNKQLREVLNPEFAIGNATKIKYGETGMYEGDRVMVIRNDYDRGVFNGDIGKIQKISIKRDEVEVKIFDWCDNSCSVPKYIDKILTFKVEEARDLLKVAYACTAHKVQGQEFDFVVMPMTMQYGVMLYRNLIYTAITRAKKKVFIFGDPKAFLFSVNNDRETVRNSNLAGLIASKKTETGSKESFAA